MNITATRNRIVEMTVVELVHLTIDIETEMFEVDEDSEKYVKFQELLEEVFSEIEQRETDSELNLG